MARFDKKWLLVHVPAGIAVVVLTVFGIAQCEGREEYAEELNEAAATVKKARETLQANVAQMDSLIGFNKGLIEKNAQQADSIVVLNDSIDSLNSRVADLNVENDSLVAANDSLATANDSLAVALKSCAKSKQQEKSTARRNVNKVIVDATKDSANWKKVEPVNDKPVVLNGKNDKMPVKSEPQKKPVMPKSVELPVAKSGNDNVAVSACGADQVIVVSDAQPVTITLDNGAANNGNVVVGNGNTVSQTTILPDTVIRFTNTKNTVVRCRVVTTQRQYK